ncbi:MAG: AraC family transcriptional regulator [Alphaproteobacteria bacterium]|nr:AraC family transcriptional regulator [Alphaproteobacteria bacterium]
MADHSSALFVALIREALRRQGIDPPIPADDHPRTVTTSLTAKKKLIEEVLAAYGPTPLLRIGVALDAFVETPLAGVLGSARDPFDLLQRWRRLERYYHSRHRTRLIETTANSLVLEHYQRSGPPPGTAEDLVVAAILAALITWLGAAGTDLDFVSDDGSWPAMRGGEVVSTDPGQPPIATGRWRLTWSDFAPRADLGRLLAAAETRWVSTGFKLEGGAIRGLFRRVLSDPARRYGLAETASEMGLSGRTLQRRLASAGAGFKDVIALARCEVAARRLVETGMPLAEIGFLAGYSDQAHFAREFRKGTGMSPSAFRDLSAPGGRTSWHAPPPPAPCCTIPKSGD